MKKKALLTITSILLVASLFGCGNKAGKVSDIAHAQTGTDKSLSKNIGTSEVFTDTAGNEIVVVDFTNNGTDYICRIDVNKGTMISSSKADSQLSDEIFSAKQAALSHAGLKEEDVLFTKAHAKTDDGTEVFEIEFISNMREFEYEIERNTLQIISADIDMADTPKNLPGEISADDAKSIALKHSDLSSQDVTFTKVKADEDDGVYVYDIEFIKDNAEYEYEIHATTGAIISFETDKEDTAPATAAADNGNKETNKSNPDTSSKKESSSSKAADSSSTKKTSSSGDLISKDKAIQTALKDAGKDKESVSLLQASLDYDDGSAHYDVEFYSDGYEYDYEVNAKTGKITQRSSEKEYVPVKQQEPAKDASKNTASDTENKTDSKKENTQSPSKEDTSSGITLSEAKNIALKDAGLSASDVRFDTAKKDRDDGVTYYEIEFYKDRVEYSYEISLSGKILERDIDRD